MSAYLGGLHFWWPKITGKLYSERWARIASVLLFIGFNLTFFPQYLLGVAGMPRRYHSYSPEFEWLNIVSSCGALVLAFGYVLPLIYLTGSLLRGRNASANPWHATGLEWRTPSPPPSNNFAAAPTVRTPPYRYRAAKQARGAPEGAPR